MQDELQVHLVRAEAALEKLSDPSFRSAYQNLYDICPWVTPYQSLAFIDAWVKYYHDAAELVLAIGSDSHGQIKGVFGLINENGVLTGIGGHQAEYHSWMCSTSDSANFVLAAFDALSRAFPGCAIRIKYLPGELDGKVLLDQSHLAERSRLVCHTRPLMKVDSEDLAKSFRKKSNKSRFNRLKKQGKLVFERIHDPERFTNELAGIRDQYDLRQGAINDSLPFADDPRKEAFHVEWFRNAVDKLHVTITKVDDKLVAAHIGAVGDGIVHLAIVAYSPFFARNSPGKLHLMELGRLFLKEGIHTLDLTPGGDPWKDRFSNSCDKVSELIVYTSAEAKRRADGYERMLVLAKSALACVGFTPSHLRSMPDVAKRATSRVFANALSNLLPKKRTHHLYRLEIDAVPEVGTRDAIHRDNLGDLLALACLESPEKRQDYLQSSLAKLERGLHVYTFDRHCAWYSNQQSTSYFTEFQQEIKFPEGSAVFEEFCSKVCGDEERLCENVLRPVLQALRDIDGVLQVYIAVRWDDAHAISSLEKLGFEFQNSISAINVLGRKKKLYC